MTLYKYDKNNYLLKYSHHVQMLGHTFAVWLVKHQQTKCIYFKLHCFAIKIVNISEWKFFRSFLSTY